MKRNISSHATSPRYGGHHVAKNFSYRHHYLTPQLPTPIRPASGGNHSSVLGILSGNKLRGINLPVSLIFGLCFALTVICGLLGFSNSVFRQRKQDQGRHRGFDSMLCLYLSAYVPAVLASEYLVKMELDSIFRVYKSTSQEQDLISLYCTSFVASAVIGTPLLSFADRFGRKRFVLLFCIFNMVSCILFHLDSLVALIFARVCSGIAMSILFSCFECWLIGECKLRAMSISEVLHILAFAQFCTGICAFVGGAVDQVVTLEKEYPMGKGWFEPLMWGGPLLSMELSVLVTLFVAVFTRYVWSENYGRALSEMDHWSPQMAPVYEQNGSLSERSQLGGAHGSSASSCTSTFFEGMKAIKKDSSLFQAAVICSCAEGAYYIFLFSWSKYINAMAPQVQIDMMFAILVLCFMIGSSVCPLVTWPTLSTSALRGAAMSSGDGQRQGPKELKLNAYLLVAALSLSPCIITHNSPLLDLCGFMVYSLCAGVYLPALAVFKCAAVPEKFRVSIYNIFRLPLYALISIMLMMEMSETGVMLLCAGLHVIAAAVYILMKSEVRKSGGFQWQHTEEYFGGFDHDEVAGLLGGDQAEDGRNDPDVESYINRSDFVDEIDSSWINGEEEEIK
eukprot:g6557.t1